MKDFDWKNTSADYSYLQNQFRRQAQKSIKQTKSLFAEHKDIYQKRMKRVYEMAWVRVINEGIYTNDRKLTGRVDKETAEEFFKIYHEAYLHEERSKGKRQKRLQPVGELLRNSGL